MDKKESIKPEVKKSKRENLIKISLMCALVIILIALAVIICKKRLDEKKDNPMNKFFDFFEKTFDNTFIDNISIDEFNSSLEMEKGTISGFFLKDLLDDIDTINTKGNRKVMIIYQDKEIMTGEEIRNIKNEIKDNYKYEVYYEYGEDKYINKAIIKISKADEIERFNSVFKYYEGTKWGTIVNPMFDAIIKANNDNVHKITLSFNGVTTQNASEIRNLKKKLDDFKDYEVYYEYDSDGFINKVVID